MIDFMVIAAPRSGTSWLANLLTTDTTLCLHDPLLTHTVERLDHIRSTKTLGVSCTALWMHPDYLAEHPAKKVIVHRDPVDICTALDALGIDPGYHAISRNAAALHDIDGLHVSYAQVFANPFPIYRHLLGAELSVERFTLLRELNIQPRLNEILPQKEAAAALVRRIQELL